MELYVRQSGLTLLAAVLVFAPAYIKATEYSAEEAAQIRADNISISTDSTETQGSSQAENYTQGRGSKGLVQGVGGECSGSCLVTTLTGADVDTAAPSQDFVFPGGGLGSLEGQFYLADDLDVPDTPGLRGWVVESVQVEGFYRFSLNESSPDGSSHTGVNLYILADEAGPDIGPEDSGTTIYPPDNSFIDRDGVEALFEDLPMASVLPSPNGDFFINLPTPVYLEPGTKYWLSVQSVGPFGFGSTAGSQWFWNQSSYGVSDGLEGGADEAQVTEDNRSADGTLLNTYILTTCGGTTPTDQAYWDVMSACGFFVGNTFQQVGSGHAAKPNLAYQLNGVALQAGFTVDPTSLTVDEFGATDTFTVVLILPPNPGVTVTLPIVSLNLAEGSVFPAFVEFTDADWNIPQMVTVRGLSDGFVDGDQAFQVQVGAPQISGGADAEYAELAAQFVDVTNLDRVGGFSIDPTFVTVDELGGADTFTVVLNIAPQAGATITLPIESLDLTEGSVAPASLDFTGANWDVPQTVTVTGLPDDLSDGDQLFLIQVGAPLVTVGSDDDFAVLDAQFVDGLNFDTGSLSGIPTLNRYGSMVLILALLLVAGFRLRHTI